MGRIRQLVQASVGAKMVMGLTGLGLFAFVITHLLGNLTLLSGRVAMNGYAAWLESKPAIIWPARIGLLAIFFTHIVFAVRLSRENRAARPERYHHEDTVKATWASRHMLLTGGVVFAFVAFHLAHFTFHAVPGTGHVEMLDGQRDVYGMVVSAFSTGWIVATYVIAQLLLGLHLIHGSKSLFQSMGWDQAVLRPLVHIVAPGLAVLVAAGNIFLPLSVYFGWLT